MRPSHKGGSLAGLIGNEKTRVTQVRPLTVEVKAYVLLDCIALDLDYKGTDSLT
jgi:hypothetical protein